MRKSTMAVIGITDEIIVDHYDNRKYKVIFIVSNDEKLPTPSFQKVLDQEIQQIVPGNYFGFDESRIFGLQIIGPREEDLIARERIESHSVAIYKLWHCNHHYFSDGENEEYLLLTKNVVMLAKHRLILPNKNDVYCFVQSLFHGCSSVRGKTCGNPVTLDTPCHDFFHADIDGVDLCIGRPIEERFGLERFGVTYGLSCHSYYTVEEGNAFFKKYPKSSIGSNKFTLRRLCAMVYDLVRMRYGLSSI